MFGLTLNHAAPSTGVGSLPIVIAESSEVYSPGSAVPVLTNCTCCYPAVDRVEIALGITYGRGPN